MKRRRIVKKYNFTDPTEISPMNVHSLEKNKKESFSRKKADNTNNVLQKLKNVLNRNFNINIELDDIILIGLIIIFMIERNTKDSNNSDKKESKDIDLIMLALVYLLL